MIDDKKIKKIRNLVKFIFSIPIVFLIYPIFLIFKDLLHGGLLTGYTFFYLTISALMLAMAICIYSGFNKELEKIEQEKFSKDKKIDSSNNKKQK